MFQQLWTLLPAQPGTITLVLAVVGSLIGVVLWVIGARFSRGILTLTAVALGTCIGLRLPEWCGWSVDGMGPAVGGAVLLGVSAFALHRLWVGLWLGLALTGWAVLLFWVAIGHDAQWAWPPYAAGYSLPQYIELLWQSLPPVMQRDLPCLAAAAMVGGISAAILLPRFGTVLMWSTAGVSMLVTMGTMAVSRLDPAMLQRLPRQTATQLMMVMALVGIGAGLQWKLMPAEVAGDSGEPSEEPDEQ